LTFKGSLVVFGAFDRFNYGDLLYPILIKQLVRIRQKGLPVRVCSMTRSDLGELGGESTEPIRDVLRAAEPDTAVVVGGGEVLSQNWFGTLLASVSQEKAQTMLRVFRDFGAEAAENLACDVLSGGRRFPWLVEGGRPPGRCRVFFNSVGGWPLENASPVVQAQSASVLSQAEFVSVREGRTWEILKSISPSLSVRLAPDLASLTARLLPKPDLEKVFLAKSAPAFRKPYLCVHANTDFIEKNLDGLHRQISRAASKLDAGIVLVPFGRCRGWNDIDGLRVLRGELGRRAEVLGPDSTLSQVTAVLANAVAFAGTSLHGLVVSAAYGVPSVAWSTPDPKVGNYLRTWPLAGDKCVEVEGTVAAIEEGIVNRESRCEVQAEVERRTLENFDLLWGCAT
jgi:hypothetical protein